MGTHNQFQLVIPKTFIHSFHYFCESFFVKMSLCDQQWKPVIYLMALSMILSKYS